MYFLVCWNLEVNGELLLLRFSVCAVETRDKRDLGGDGRSLHVYEGADFVAVEQGGEVAFLVHIEDDDGHIAFAAEGEGGLVHHFEAVGDGFVET